MPTDIPAWARGANAPESEAEAAFFAGAALSQLDAVVRENPPWAGVFRRRLALSAAAASVLRAGRTEDEAALRDALHLTWPGADPGPAGRRLIAWRELSAHSLGQWRSSFHAAAAALGIPHDEGLQEAIDAAEACAGGRPAPFAAAQIFGLARRALTQGGGRPSRSGRGGEGELLAVWLADCVLARRLNWPFALPLLAAQLFAPAARRAVGDRADGAEAARILFGYARGAAQACDLSADLGRRAQKLQAAAPKLRAKGLRRRCRRCSTTTRSARPPKSAGKCRSADREDCSTGWSRSARFANSPDARRSGSTGSKAMARSRKTSGDLDLDLDLEDLPAPARWREWMGRVEAAIFASGEPVKRENLARVVGKACNLELIIADIRDELRGRPYEIVSVAGGWSFRTKLGFGEAIRTAIGGPQRTELSKSNALVLMAIGYFQPITRGELSQFFEREVSRDAIAALRGEGFIAAGPRSPTPGAPYAYVTTPGFLAHFGFESLRDLPDIETLEDAGLLGRTSEALLDGDALASELRGVLGLSGGEDGPEEDAA